MSVQIIKKDVKQINIKVKPNCEVILTAPINTTDEHIDHILKKRSLWIEDRMAYFRQYQSPVLKEYVSGENFAYLGRNYRLKVVESQYEGVKLQRGYLQIFVKDKTNLNRKTKLVKKWYLAKAEQHFQKAIIKYQSVVKKEIASVQIREMKTRWGSCNPSKGYINLNSELIKKPTECIEYVIFHELAHLVYPDHSQQFYNYLTLFMPDWEKRKERLNHFR